MDSVPSYEYGFMFRRLCVEIDLTDCPTATAIQNKLKIARLQAKIHAKSAQNKRAKKRWWYKADQLDKLIEHDFAGRAIFEANRHPRGFIALTLTYGRVTAGKRIAAQTRAQVRARLGFAGTSKTPELRRKPVWRW